MKLQSMLFGPGRSAWVVCTCTVLCLPPLMQANDLSAPASGQGLFLPQPGISTIEAQELLEVIATRARAELGYHGAEPQFAALMPSSPDRVRGLRIMARVDAQGTYLLQLGYRAFRSQPVHIWLFGQMVNAKGVVDTNGDLAHLTKMLDEAQVGLDQAHQNLKPTDLAHQRITLSHIDSTRCTQMLRVFGYTIIDPGTPLDLANMLLPVIVDAPPPTEAEVNLVPAPTTDLPPTISDPVTELVVFYHPNRPEQFAQVLDKIRNLIDVPARQVVVEVMILEIAQKGLNRLGVQWDLGSPVRHINSLKLGRLPGPGVGTDEEATANVELSNVFGEFAATLRALIRSGYAEVLARPSVLTLNNRMAFINIVENIPVVNSISNPSSNTVIVDFVDKPAGIQLGVRPRVSADGEEISMVVSASVTVRVPNEDVVVRDSLGNEVARSPTITLRQVQTQTRIANNTPLIVGGLVAKDDLTEMNKVPFLGDLPLIGAAFRDERTSKNKREVIIIVTPRVLPENQVVGPALPEDEDAFDSFDNKLFRDAYRIRTEDVFDLAFLLENRQLQRFQHLADLLVRRNADLAQQYPFDRFSGNRVPGERILVYRQMYEVIKRRAIEKDLDPDRIIFFQRDPSQRGFQANFLAEYLAEQVGALTASRETGFREIFHLLEGKAVAMTYTLQAYDADPSDILRQPVPNVYMVDCPDQTTWSRLLWELNQPDREGRQRRTILLRTEDDLIRLKRALVLKRTVKLNASYRSLTLKNYSIGRMLMIPTVKTEKIHLIDDESAKYFFYTEQYYPAVELEMNRDLQAMRGLLEDPTFRRMLPELEAERGLGPVEWAPQ